MNREELIATLAEKLDVDKNGKVNLNDVATYISANANRKLYAVGIGCFVVGVLIGRFAL